MFSVVASFLADDCGRFVAEVEAVGLQCESSPVQGIWARGVLLLLAGVLAGFHAAHSLPICLPIKWPEVSGGPGFPS